MELNFNHPLNEFNWINGLDLSYRDVDLILQQIKKETKYKNGSCPTSVYYIYAINYNSNKFKEQGNEFKEQGDDASLT